jgi:hypothetical protein
MGRYGKKFWLRQLQNPEGYMLLIPYKTHSTNATTREAD